jgi:hypothetical protein
MSKLKFNPLPDWDDVNYDQSNNFDTNYYDSIADSKDFNYSNNPQNISHSNRIYHSSSKPVEITSPSNSEISEDGIYKNLKPNRSINYRSNNNDELKSYSKQIELYIANQSNNEISNLSSNSNRSSLWKSRDSITQQKDKIISHKNNTVSDGSSKRLLNIFRSSEAIGDPKIDISEEFKES